MRPRALLLQELISNGLYAVDERWVADAMVARVAIRGSVAEPALGNETQPGAVRSFRRDPRARSFRLERPSGVHFRRKLTEIT